MKVACTVLRGRRRSNAPSLPGPGAAMRRGYNYSRLKHRLRPMRGLRTEQTAQVIIAGHAFMQNLRRGHYEPAVDAPPALRVAAAFAELARAI
ncbi:hypothetical protein GCM10010199_47150 [Dactylosporangium roseum]